jgi:quercetin dioxygenase-like cupin family protein
VLDGDVTFYVGEETYRAGTGTFVFLPHGVPHSYTFETDVVRMLCIIRAWRVWKRTSGMLVSASWPRL